MEQDAKDRAIAHLRRAKKAVADLDEATAFDDIHDAWGHFLAAADGIYEVLHTGSKTNGKSDAWFGRQKHVRKKDQLLSYIHQARNVDHHGVKSVTDAHAAPKLSIGEGEGYTVRGVAEGHTRITRSRADAKIVFRVKLPGVHLEPVTSKEGDIFQVPAVHLDQPITDKRPKSIATLALTYLEVLVDEATKLA